MSTRLKVLVNANLEGDFPRDINIEEMDFTMNSDELA